MSEIICKICNKSFDNCRSIATHINKIHKITSSEYYLKYVNDNNKCIICCSPTTFKGVELGFRKYCSSKCANNDKEIQDKIKETNLSRYSGSRCDESNKNKKINILNEIIRCKGCGRGYKVASGEFDLLRKMNLPLPHECPKCRENNRFLRLNKPTKLYNRNCAKCNVKIRTPYSPDRSEIIYCEKCYQQEVY